MTAGLSLLPMFTLDEIEESLNGNRVVVSKRTLEEIVRGLGIEWDEDAAE